MSDQFAKRFGLLEYPGTDNLGDEIQSIAARRFLPRVNRYFNREALNEVKSPDGIPYWTIMNGWYCHIPSHWPPSKAIHPLFVAVHITEEATSSGVRPSDVMLSEANARYLRAHGPVGARDLNTLKLLRAAGVESYFSGCMTLTLQRPRVPRHDDLVVLNDIPAPIAEFVKSARPARIITSTHSTGGETDSHKRFAMARSLLDLYAAAKCVITTRLHCALPCLAIGTPVLFLAKVHDQYRFSGLEDFTHHCTPADFLSGRYAFDVNAPPPNPTRHLPYRESLSATARAFVQTPAERLAA